jgi:Raf kinase inhibitor-like YbhB/YbcL family protein
MKNVMVSGMAVGVFVFLAAGSADAQTNPGGRPVLAKELAPARAHGELRVVSRVLRSGQEMGNRFTQDGENHNPAVTWTKGPSGTQSYAIIMGDASVDRPEPVVHWVIYNIPSTAERVAENQPKEAELGNGAEQGLNFGNTVGYIGPKLAVGETHQYHIQVFALNTRLKLEPAKTDRADIVQAMKGHVLASGDLVVTHTGN